MTKRSLGGKAEMWGCIGTVTAAIIAGIFSVIVALITDVDLGDLLRGESGSRQGPVAPANTAAPVAQATPTPFATQAIQLPWEANPIDIPPPDPNAVAAGISLSGATTCPADVRAVRMDIPSQWYGPFGFNASNYIMFDPWYFYTWDAAQFNVFTGSYGVSSQVNRVPNEPINQWLQLPNSYFWVCIDSRGYLFTVYGGN